MRGKKEQKAEWENREEYRRT